MEFSNGTNPVIAKYDEQMYPDRLHPMATLESWPHFQGTIETPSGHFSSERYKSEAPDVEHGLQLRLCV